MKFKKWMVIFLILMMGGAAFAGGLTYYGQAKNHDNSNAAAGNKVECWEGSFTTGPTGPNFVVGSPTLSPNPPNYPVTTRADGKLCPQGTTNDNFYDPRANVSVKVRVWEGSDPAAVINAKGYYGYGTYSIGGVTAPPATVNATITTNYKADRPDSPTVTAGGYNLTWNDTKQQYLVSFSLSAVAGAAWNSEGVSYQIRVRKATDSYTAGRTHDGASWTITETNLDDPYYVGGGAYVAQAHATNAFGDIWGPEMNFVIPTGGAVGVGGAGPVTYYLRKSVGDAVGLNAVSVLHTVPFKVDATPEASVTTIGQLAAAINLKSGAANTVTTFGWMESGAMKGFYITYDAGGVPAYTAVGGVTGGADTPLERGRSYQISVINDVDVTFSQ